MKFKRTFSDALAVASNTCNSLCICKTNKYKAKATLVQVYSSNSGLYFTLLFAVQSLRSLDGDLLTVPRISSKCADGASSYCGPSLWNKLPADL